MTERQNGTGTSAGRARGPVTIYDVARLSGVSPSTVSRALNNPGRLSADTEKRIREVADAVGYRLNPMARALPTGRTHTVGLILSDITNPVYFDLVRGVERVAAGRGYILILAESQESADLENETAQRLLASVDGLVLVATRLDNADIRALAERKPLFVVNRKVRGIPGVVPDVVPGIRAALDHLAEQGHRSIAYLAGPSGSWMSRLRGRTLAAAAGERGMTIVEIGPGEPTLQGGQAALQSIRDSGATAVLAYNDLMATGLLKACRDGGVRVPEELSVIGFDDIFGSDFTSPPLTTIRTPLGLVGDEAARRLIAAVEKGEEGRRTPLATEFVLRGSTAPPRG
ncbi:LacI family DNA-binding transcriptional regulator [Modestobacter sp. VKM Ac-2985]|uniref:LacI family DNA-binding transcriptional regulator n=1 Tax=Modestobacter sp. VKM Ac-2985 TaxID=3004139 RepID=UPI0022ABA7F4|nr:LacI family DNA-binding transcriptional regulator [Modestobacter sp. VKM Ac-2985]MCZ2840150.1 LacI family DNA-binding transcriptional regulator [Modestobacter sp. VKM Ac-2985]